MLLNVCYVLDTLCFLRTTMSMGLRNRKQLAGAGCNRKPFANFVLFFVWKPAVSKRKWIDDPFFSVMNELRKFGTAFNVLLQLVLPLWLTKVFDGFSCPNGRKGREVNHTNWRMANKLIVIQILQFCYFKVLVIFANKSPSWIYHL